MDGRIRLGGFTWSDGIVAFVILLCLAGLAIIVWPVYQRERFVDNLVACGTNLSAIGKAMSVYANDYDSKLPMAGG